MKISIFILIFLMGVHCKADHILAIGESQWLPAPAGQKVRVQKKGLFRVKDLGERIKITGKKIGQTKVTVGHRVYQIKVVKKTQYQCFKQLKSWQENKRGPEVFFENKFMHIKGRILRSSDFRELPLFLSRQCKVKISAKWDPKTKEEVQSLIDEELRKSGLLFGDLNWSPYLRMNLDKSFKDQKSLYQKVLGRFGIPIHFEEKSTSQKPMVEIKVFVAHVRKSFLRQWGFQWPSQFSAQLIPQSQLEFDSITLSLQALESEGLGQTLASPTLVTESGNKAEFHSGGEFPIQTSTQFTNAVEWKRYGLTLKVIPFVNRQKHLMIDVNIDVSSLDHSQTRQNIPSLFRNLLKTKINMKKPHPFFLSGFLQQFDQQGDSGIPWLRQIPILNPLFTSKRIFSNDFELVFIMVPQIYEH